VTHLVSPARLKPFKARAGSGASAWLLVLAIVVALLGQARSSAYAQTVGATLTVLRGSAGVVRADGTPLSPAASGITLGRGDRVATLGRSSALVTFFEGSELELGGDTTIIIRDLDRQGGRTTVSIESVVGTMLSRVVTLTDPGASYRIEAGGTVALVRGTVFAHHVDAAGDITVAVGEGNVQYPAQGAALRRGDKRTVTSRGDVVDNRFDPSLSLFTVVTEPASSGNPSGTDNPGIGTGSFTAPQQQSQQQGDTEREQQPRPVSSPGHTFLIATAPSGTTRLEVDSIEGFVLGDQIRIGSGPNTEFDTIVGFGSILLRQPLVGSFDAGAPVDLVAHTVATPAPTATGTWTPTPTPTGTLGAIGTVVLSPMATATVTRTAMATATATATPTPTPAAMASATHTLTAMATATPTAFPTPTHTHTTTAIPTATHTATATATQTPTVTPTATPPFPCLGLLDRELATRGGGTTGTTQAAAPAGVRLTVYVQLVGAAADTAFDVYVDVAGGSAGVHRLVGTFTTDGSGDGILTGSIVVPTVAATIDNEVVLKGDSSSRHQYIRELFSPCLE
jgi:hypothetical protein